MIDMLKYADKILFYVKIVDKFLIRLIEDFIALIVYPIIILFLLCLPPSPIKRMAHCTLKIYQDIQRLLYSSSALFSLSPSII